MAIVTALADTTSGTLVYPYVLNNYAVAVNSIAELKALDTQKLYHRQAVYVKGYYEPDGRGGGCFTWLSNLTGVIDDSGWYIKPASNPITGIWERTLSNGEIPNVYMWGARPFHYSLLYTSPPYTAPDASPGIQAAIDGLWLRNQPLGPYNSYSDWQIGYKEGRRKLLIPNGNWRLRSTLVVRPRIWLCGEGTYESTHLYVFSGDNIDMIRSESANNQITGVYENKPDPAWAAAGALALWQSKTVSGFYCDSTIHAAHPEIPTAEPYLGGDYCGYLGFDHGFTLSDMALAYWPAAPENGWAPTDTPWGTLQYYNGGASASSTNYTNSAIVVFRPGEAFSIRNMNIVGGRYGIRVIDNTTPGFFGENISCHWFVEAGIIAENGKWWYWNPVAGDWYLDSYYTAGTLFRVDRLSCDRWDPINKPSGSAIKIVGGNTLTAHNLKCEGWFGGGVICVMPHSGVGRSTNITLNGLHGNFSDLYNTETGSSPIVRIAPYSGLGTVNLRKAYETPGLPVISLKGISAYGIKYLIKDDILGYSVRPQPWHQGSNYWAKNPTEINYTSHVVGHSNNRIQGLCTNRENTKEKITFQPSGSGWYRVAKSVNRYLGGRFTISTNSNSADFVDFSLNSPPETQHVADLNYSLYRPEFVVYSNHQAARPLGYTNDASWASSLVLSTQRVVTKARAYTYLERRFYGDTSTYNLISYLDIFVERPFTTSELAEDDDYDSHLEVIITNDNPLRGGNLQGQLLNPYLITGTFDAEDNSYGHWIFPSGATSNQYNFGVRSYGEVDFRRRGGVMMNTQGVNNAHLVMGETHIWVDEQQKLKLYNDGADIVVIDEDSSALYTDFIVSFGRNFNIPIPEGTSAFVDTSAQAIAADNAIGIEYCRPKSFHTKPTNYKIFVTPRVTGNGTGAILTVATDYYNRMITFPATTVGSGYMKQPKDYQGYKIHTDVEYGNQRFGSRLISGNDCFTVSTTANSRVITGSNFYTRLYVNDRLIGPNSSNYKISYIVSDSLAILETKYPTALSNASFYRGGYSLIAPESGYQFNLTDLKVQLLNQYAWGRGSGFDHLSIQSTAGTVAANVYETGMSGVNRFPTIEYIYPTGAFYTGGFGGALEPNSGIEITYRNSSNVIVCPTGGTGVARITVSAVMNRNGYVY